MDQVYSTTNEHKKGQHLSKYDRALIGIRLKDGWNANRIAKEIGCSPNTVRNEIKRGTVSSPDGGSHQYQAKAGQAVYEQNRQASCRHYDFLEKGAFIQYVEERFNQDKWSIDSCVGRALRDGNFSREQIVCTKTLYNYIDLGLLGIKNIDLPDKLRRSPRKARERENKRKLGRSIDERDKEVEERKEFGHWECDLVIGAKSGEDDALLTMLERMSREFLVIRIPGKDAKSVMEALERLRAQYSEHWDEIFKTITTDNGSEFSQLSDLESISKTLVYYAHPYTSCEKGSIERHNGLLRRFIPKGKRIDSYSDEKLSQIEVWCNSLPRKILDYKTADEVFEAELDKIYGFAA